MRGLNLDIGKLESREEGKNYRWKDQCKQCQRPIHGLTRKN